METASSGDEITLPEGYVGYWVDDDGNKIWITQEELYEGLAAAEEFKRQEAERIAKEQAEKEWWESKQEWIDRFPFKPTHHPEITFDPSVYDPNNRKPREERDKAYEQMRGLVKTTASCEGFAKAGCLMPNSSSRCTPSLPKKSASLTPSSISVWRSIPSRSTIRQWRKPPMQSIGRTPKCIDLRRLRKTRPASWMA